MTKIVITDADTMTRGDLDLHVLEKYGELTIYPTTHGEEECVKHIGDADVVLLNKTEITASILQRVNHVKYIGLFATGYNVIDLDACKERGICVCNAGGYSTDGVAQTVFGFILNHACRTAEYDAFVKAGGWVRSTTFSPFIYPTMEIAGKTIGLIGYGAIGKKVAVIARAFGMRVLVHTRTPQTDDTVTFVPFDRLLNESDFVSVHCPLTPQTAKMFDSTAFLKMKKGAYFINTSRGGVVVEEDLRTALISGKLSGAGIDVLNTEPMQADCKLLDAPNITITPHIAWASLETRKRLLDIVCNNLEGYLQGKPQNVVV